MVGTGARQSVAVHLVAARKQKDRGRKEPGIRYIFPGHAPTEHSPFWAPHLNNASSMGSMQELFQPIPKAHEQATNHISSNGVLGHF